MYVKQLEKYLIQRRCSIKYFLPSIIESPQCIQRLGFVGHSILYIWDRHSIMCMNGNKLWFPNCEILHLSRPDLNITSSIVWSVSQRLTDFTLPMNSLNILLLLLCYLAQFFLDMLLLVDMLDLPYKMQSLLAGRNCFIIFCFSFSA